MNAPTLAALTAIALTLGAVFFWNRAQRPKGLPGRAVLSLDEIYDRFYRDSGFSRDDVGRALDVIARAFGVKSGLLRPTDRFGDDLKVPHGWDSFDSPLDELSDELRSLLGVDDAVQPLRRTSYGRLHRILAGCYFESRQPGNFVRHMMESLRQDPRNIGYFAAWPLRVISRRRARVAA